MPLRIAILDLGTNTFHLLVAEQAADNQPAILYRDEKWVFLAEKGIETIAASAIERAHKTLLQYNKVIHEYQCHLIMAFVRLLSERRSTAMSLVK